MNIESLIITTTPGQADILTDNQFYNDVITGLSADPKRLNSKYFYDAVGDELFQGIMNSPEYYLTRCELEIFSEQTSALAKHITTNDEGFDLIELGAGDALKSTYLLRHLLQQQVDFTYLPIDISAHVIQLLNEQLGRSLPGLKFTGLNGEYFDMLKRAATLSDRRKVLFVLGSNIGNMPIAESEQFCHDLRKHLSPGDRVLIGFDLKKNPKTILAAYNDKAGITRKFNLNLLNRINKELGADFNTGQFDHYPTYDPETGSCKSYLISLADQTVQFKSSGKVVHFRKDEPIYMEISQKFTLKQITDIASRTGFKPVEYLFDNKAWFTDAVWVAQ